MKLETIDRPLVPLIRNLNNLPHCFTLQSCYGHFVYNDGQTQQNLDPLPMATNISTVIYRIAYLAVCIENSRSGRRLLSAMKEITKMDPENIQLGSPGWFWKRQLNSYALQVEPTRYKNRDKVVLDYVEALKIERVRNYFFRRVERFLFS